MPFFFQIQLTHYLCTIFGWTTFRLIILILFGLRGSDQDYVIIVEGT